MLSIVLSYIKAFHMQCFTNRLIT